ncbi:glycoside hydrolase superfamily [Xylogone sp. PMI_703]|nr:glycoside hydrolase superfamily [Xylogone sp. PMI_703]
MKATSTLGFFSVLAVLSAARIPERQSSAGTATVNLAQHNGPPRALGSGFIYGWPDNSISAQTLIPSYLVKDIKFGANRAGGAQIAAPGWAYDGYDGYIGRFNSSLSNYRSTREYGGEFILLPHDLWGAQGGANSETPFPGDNGNWTEMEIFLNQVIKDLKANNMLDGLIIDLWNEPDGSGFWARPWSQYLEYFNRATKIVRAELPRTLISGPSMANSPSLDNTNWQTWMASIAGNDTVPDHYSWHQIGSWEREPDTTVPDFNTLRGTYGLPTRPIDVNEYAWPSEQNPGNAVYYLAQFERHDIRALRANWGSGPGLHNWMANLVYSTNGTYYPNGEWQVYKYYAHMTGNRVATTASSDLLFDVFATTSGNIAKVLAGTRTVQSPYDISISGLSRLGLPRQGTIKVHTYRFDFSGSEGEIDAPVDLGYSTFSYSSDTVRIPSYSMRTCP